MTVIKRIYNFLYTLTYFVSLVPLRLYDMWYGTHYAHIEKSGDIDGRFEYYPSPVLMVPFLRRYICRSLNGGIGHSVLDIGCGKGFVLNVFSFFRFTKISGIEFNKKLCQYAKNNLRRNHRKISVYNIDALNFPNYKDYDTFYLYNPFNDKIMSEVIDRIVDSYNDNPRIITILYCNPVYERILIDRGFSKVNHFYYKTSVYVYNKINEY